MEQIRKCIELKKDLDLLRPLKKDDNVRIMQKFRLDWNYHSIHLEGNSLTFGETKALILYGLTAQGKPLKDHFEATGHNNAIDWVYDLVKKKTPLNEKVIRELHELILVKPYKNKAITADGQPSTKTIHVGEYKTTPNHVKTSTGEIFQFASPEETPAKMEELQNWFKKKSKEIDVNPVLFAAEYHYRFIRIHPFDDGNGRIARLLMNFILMMYGYPPIIIKTEDKENYYAALRLVDADFKNLEVFVSYLAINLIVSLKIMVAGAKGEDIEEEDDFEKEIALLEQKVKKSSRKIKKYKDEKLVLKLYDETIVPTFQYFVKKCQVMDRFYRNVKFSIFINNNSRYYAAIEKTIAENRKRIDKETSIIDIRYKYLVFDREGFENFTFDSQIVFRFDNTEINILSRSGDDKLLYGENLLPKDIKVLVDAEVNLHKLRIEERLNELKERK